MRNVCTYVRTLYKMQVRIGVLVVYTCEADTCDVIKDGLSITSARPSPQPCLSILVVLGILEITSED